MTYEKVYCLGLYRCANVVNEKASTVNRGFNCIYKDSGRISIGEHVYSSNITLLRKPCKVFKESYD